MFVFCDGQAAIATASRAISPDEQRLCRENRIPWVQLPVALDAIVVAVGTGVDVDCLNITDLYALRGPEAGGTRSRTASVRLLRTRAGHDHRPGAHRQHPPVITPHSCVISLRVSRTSRRAMLLRHGNRVSSASGFRTTISR
jgi:hypothetical protein